MVVIERWVTVIDKNTCDRCRALNGRTFQAEHGPQAPLHPECRCRRVFDHFVDVPPPGEDEDDDDEE